MIGGLHVKDNKYRYGFEFIQYGLQRRSSHGQYICHYLISFCNFSVFVERSKSTSSQLAEQQEWIILSANLIKFCQTRSCSILLLPWTWPPASNTTAPIQCAAMYTSRKKLSRLQLILTCNIFDIFLPYVTLGFVLGQKFEICRTNTGNCCTTLPPWAANAEKAILWRRLHKLEHSG